MKTAKSERIIKKNLRELREFIDAPNQDVLAARIAYAMENAVRWVIENTEGWSPLVDEAFAEAETARRELGLPAPKKRIE